MQHTAAPSALNEAGAASATSRTRRATRTRVPRTGTPPPARTSTARPPAASTRGDGIRPRHHGRQADDDAAAKPRAHGSADSEMNLSAPVGWCLDDRAAPEPVRREVPLAIRGGPVRARVTPEQVRAKMIAQVEKARDAAAADEARAQADAMPDVVRSIPLGPDLRIVRDDGPESG